MIQAHEAAAFNVAATFLMFCYALQDPKLALSYTMILFIVLFGFGALVGAIRDRRKR